jgi:hypothetical protein
MAFEHLLIIFLRGGCILLASPDKDDELEELHEHVDALRGLRIVSKTITIPFTTDQRAHNIKVPAAIFITLSLLVADIQTREPTRTAGRHIRLDPSRQDGRHR